MNVSSVMARIAGTESTANRMSTSAMPASAAPPGRERQPRWSLPTSACSRVVVVAVAEQPPARPDQEGGEHEAQPAERRQRRGADDDEQRRAGRARARCRRSAAGGARPRARANAREHEQEDEDVVERERLLDQVAGQERLASPLSPTSEQDGEERERDRRPTPRWRRRRRAASSRRRGRARRRGRWRAGRRGRRSGRAVGTTGYLRGSWIREGFSAAWSGREHRDGAIGARPCDGARRRDTSLRLHVGRLAPNVGVGEERRDALLVRRRVLPQRGRVRRPCGRYQSSLRVAAGAVVELAPLLLDLAGGDEQVRRARVRDPVGERDLRGRSGPG